jgi:hypothetical protein
MTAGNEPFRAVALEHACIVLVVPLASGRGRLEGVLLLGQKKSEEP